MTSPEAHAAIDGIRARMCVGKVKYNSEWKANLGIDKIRACHPLDVTPMRVYSCVFCNGYHVGRQPRSKMLKNAEHYLQVEFLVDYDFSERDLPACLLKPKRTSMSHQQRKSLAILYERNREEAGE